MKGQVQTVLGDVLPIELGKTLTHEHISTDIVDVFYKEPLYKKHLVNSDISLHSLGWIRQNPYSSIANMKMNGPELESVFLQELKGFKEAGGGTIVENTTTGLNRDVEIMKKMSQEVNIHIIAGTGYYVSSSQTQETLKLSVESMADMMTKELTVGCIPNPTIKCGILGEVGCSWPLSEFERRTLRASAEVESKVGCPVMIHPGRDQRAPEEVIRVFAEAGGNSGRVVMAHLDRTFHNFEDILEFAKFGTYLEYDLFGMETSSYKQNPDVDMPSDAQRIACIKHLVDNGYEDKIVIAHDIHTKHRLESFGGHGFCHIFNEVLPVMLRRGFSQEIIDKILIHNPAEWLTFVK